jgi:hypothetical protein
LRLGRQLQLFLPFLTIYESHIVGQVLGLSHSQVRCQLRFKVPLRIETSLVSLYRTSVCVGTSYGIDIIKSHGIGCMMHGVNCPPLLGLPPFQPLKISRRPAITSWHRPFVSSLEKDGG